MVTEAVSEGVRLSIEFCASKNRRFKSVYLVSAYTQLFELSLQSGGQANASDVGLHRDRMLDFVNKLDTTNQQLYAAVDYTQLADIVNLYTVPSIVVEDLVPESYVNRDVYNTSLRKVNLVNGIVEFVVSEDVSVGYNANLPSPPSDQSRPTYDEPTPFHFRT